MSRSPMSALSRILALVRAQLSGEVLGERTPVAALAMQTVVAGLVCALVRGESGTLGYALVALSIPLALTAVPLLGELGPLLQADRAAEWVGALPVRPRELRVARVVTLLSIVGMLALASLVPAALLAPGDFGIGGRVGLVGLGALLTWCTSAALLAAQSLLAKLGEAAAVFLQTAVFLGVLVGFLGGLGQLSALAELTGEEAGLRWLPQAWFAAPLAGLWGSTPGEWPLAMAGASVALAALILGVAPFPPAPASRSTRSVLSTLLTPLRRAAELLWVRPAERGSFAFVHDALPAERDFVLRTYPLVAAPLLFLVFGADPSKLEGEGLYALLLFAPAAYLPFVLMHVPTTNTPEARWVVDTAPVTIEDEDGGAAKAVAVRLLAPLYLGIGALVWIVAGRELCLRLWPLAVASGLVTLRMLYRRGVGRPLSTSTQDLASAWSDGLGGSVMGLSVGQTLLAVAAWRLVPEIWMGWAALGLVLVVELAGARTKTARPAMEPSGRV